MKNRKKTLLITGAGQGIGQAIALRFASHGANVVIASNDSSGQLQETIDLISAAGGRALTCAVDVRDCDQLCPLVDQVIAHFGGIDILVNNTSAPCFQDTFHTDPQQFDLIVSTSVRAAFFLSQICYPHLKEAENPHIINIAPPLNLDEQWLRDHLAFSIQFSQAKIAVNSLWPQTNIATQRLKEHLLPEVYAGSRHPTIMADATYALSLKTYLEASGKFYIDEQLLRETGVTDFTHYAIDPQSPLVQTLFLPLKEGMIPITPALFRRDKP